MESIILLLTVAIFGLPHATTTLQVDGFTYLGNLRTRGSANEKQFIGSDYYVSAYSAIWSTAEEQCYYKFGEDGHLVSLETMEEELGVDELLEDFGSGGDFKLRFWTGGRFNITSGVWDWIGTLEPIMETNWGPDGAPLNPNGRQRVVVQHLGGEGVQSYWISIDDTSLSRYVCELHHPTP